MNQKDAFEMARFGVEAERFISSPIGRYLMERAEHDRDKAIEEMKSVIPTDSAAVERIQNALTIPDKIVRWLTDAIQSGHAAYDALVENEAENDIYPDAAGAMLEE